MPVGGAVAPMQQPPPSPTPHPTVHGGLVHGVNKATAKTTVHMPKMEPKNLLCPKAALLLPKGNIFRFKPKNLPRPKAKPQGKVPVPRHRQAHTGNSPTRLAQRDAEIESLWQRLRRVYPRAHWDDYFFGMGRAWTQNMLEIDLEIMEAHHREVLRTTDGSCYPLGSPLRPVTAAGAHSVTEHGTRVPPTAATSATTGTHSVTEHGTEVPSTAASFTTELITEVMSMDDTGAHSVTKPMDNEGTHSVTEHGTEIISIDSSSDKTVIGDDDLRQMLQDHLG